MYLLKQMLRIYLFSQVLQGIQISSISCILPSQVMQNRILGRSLTASKHTCTLQGIDWLECLLRCNSDTNCVSYNFMPKVEKCQLNAFGLHDKCDGKELVFHQEALFHQIRINENLPKCMSSSTCGQSVSQAGQDSCASPMLFRSSCDDIVRNQESRGDGEYTIKPAGLDKQRVYCDMTTNGGGWTLLKKVTMPIPSGSMTFLSNTAAILTNYNDPYKLIIPRGLGRVRKALDFKQMRWFCKKQDGNSVHVMTNEDSKGHEVIRYFSESIIPATACGSFTKLTNDTSKLTDNCSRWGYKIGSNQWGSTHYNGEQRVHGKIMLWNGFDGRIFSMMPGEYLCDDEKPRDWKNGDSWALYVR